MLEYIWKKYRKKAGAVMGKVTLPASVSDYRDKDRELTNLSIKFSLVEVSQMFMSVCCYKY